MTTYYLRVRLPEQPEDMADRPLCQAPYRLLSDAGLNICCAQGEDFKHASENAALIEQRVPGAKVHVVPGPCPKSVEDEEWFLETINGDKS